MILCRYILTELGIGIQLSKNTTHGWEITHEGCMAPMVDLNNYDFGFLIINKSIIAYEYLLSSYAEDF